jgi:EAL domain-containing protein (putative c-di-GMP-specific phosphodiesterase class I)/DNA-binding NarL/FixJ family response regulator
MAIQPQTQNRPVEVLLVEDNPGDARLIQETLRQHGDGEFNLVHESCLQDALQELSQENADAILLDLSLPEASGLETLLQVQQADPVTPIIVLTGLNDEATALQALRLGAQDYLLKSRLNGDSLVRTLRYSVERNRHGLLRKLESLETALNHSFHTLMRFEEKKINKKKPSPQEDFRNSADDEEVNLAEILEKERVAVHFQPWVSLKENSIVGFEGLCRGVESLSGGLISPVTLLRQAGHRKLLNSLDRLFHRKVMESFKPALLRNPELILSLNFATAVLNDNQNSFKDFIDSVQENEIDPSHIVIEILEAQVPDIYRLQKFIELHRGLGFLIALDDVGSGYSSFQRIAALKPDLIKADRSLVLGIDKSHHQREMFKSMVQLAHGLGALLVAEGTETEAEAMLALELGADLLQGFYFARPEEMRDGLFTDCEEKIGDAVAKFKRHIIGNINAKRSQYRQYDWLISRMTQELAAATPKDYDLKLFEIAQRYPQVDCLFILDEGGTQMSRLVSNEASSEPEKVFFKASGRGANHSLKDYYYNLIEGDLKERTFVTEPYLSTVKGKLCVTISTLFRNAYGHLDLLCVNMKPEHLPDSGPGA